MRSASSAEMAAAGIRGTPSRVVHVAGVRRSQPGRADRSHQRRDRAMPRGGAGAAGPIGVRLAVAHVGGVEQDDLALGLGGR